MQENDLLIKFIDIFDSKYAPSIIQDFGDQNHIRIAKNNQNDSELGSILQEPLITERTG